VAINYGFIEKGEISLFAAPLPDYSIEALSNDKLSTALCGLIGTVLTFVICLTFGLTLLQKNLDS
jgi:hypothetical protein